MWISAETNERDVRATEERSTRQRALHALFGGVGLIRAGRGAGAGPSVDTEARRAGTGFVDSSS